MSHPAFPSFSLFRAHAHIHNRYASFHPPQFYKVTIWGRYIVNVSIVFYLYNLFSTELCRSPLYERKYNTFTLSKYHSSLSVVHSSSVLHLYLVCMYNGNIREIIQRFSQQTFWLVKLGKAQVLLHKRGLSSRQLSQRAKWRWATIYMIRTQTTAAKGNSAIIHFITYPFACHSVCPIGFFQNIFWHCNHFKQ